MSTTAILILAAGDGKRMKTGIPKVVNPLHDEPLVGHVVRAVEQSNLVDKPLVVVSPNHTLVQDYLGERARYVVQDKQLGTGHAVAIAEDLLKDKADAIVVLYGDMPFITPESIQRLVAEHATKRNVVTLMTVAVPTFEGTYAQFKDFGRIIRDASGKIIKSIEARDASSEELRITEVNPCIFCFDGPWLWANIKMLRNANSQGEYYLTDLIAMAIKTENPMSSIVVDYKEAVGINTKEHLEAAHTL